MAAPSSKKDRPAHRCAECGVAVAKWVGQCPQCQAWGSIIEAGATRVALSAGPVTAPARPIGEIDVEAARARPTGVDELDRVLGGGLVPGGVVLLAGEPGVGTSTLLSAVCARAARGGAPVLYVSGEESAAQVRLRAERTGDLAPTLWLAAETDLAAVIAHVDAVRPELLVVDSVQTVASGQVDGTAGGVTQVRAVAAALIGLAKERGIATVLVGHVTKDGSIAGPRLLEHLVDVVLHFEGERHSPLRLVRAVKNRFGPADEVGCFEMTDSGIEGLADPSGLFLSDRGRPVAGTCVTVTVEGRRPMLAEVQALVAGTSANNPRRAVSGLDSSRVAMVLAIVERRGMIKLSDKDVYTATVGGMRLSEPSVDLAVALAVASAEAERPIPVDVVVMGELALSGELRKVSGVQRRLAEAARLGYTRAIAPVGSGTPPEGMRVLEARDLWHALEALNGVAPRPVKRDRGALTVV
jgi:DNA repair protein RadA/Sms